jgi:hypothetical protein
MSDFFDLNSVGGDSHLQFMNWAVDQNGAYDYAADTRGYTFGVILEYQSPKSGLRFAEALLPTVANGQDLQWNLRKANASNVEFELHRGFLKKKDGIIRVLAFVNNAIWASIRLPTTNTSPIPSHHLTSPTILRRSQPSMGLDSTSNRF